jgi:hypothetical protein
MTTLNIRDPFFVMTILIISFFWWGSCEKEKRKDLEQEQGERLHREQVQALTARALKADSLAQVIRKNRTVARVKDSVEIRGLKQRIARLKTKDAELAYVSDSVISHVWEGTEQWRWDVKDSIIQSQDTLILKLELRYDATVFSYEEELKQRGDQAIAEASKAESWRLEAVDARKDEGKEKRRKGFWRTTTAILAGGVLFLSLQQ